jgi:hypothetical protein
MVLQVVAQPSVDVPGTLRGLQVSAAEVSTSSLASGFVNASFQTVFTGDVTIPSSAALTIRFTTPFAYQKTGNILFQVRDFSRLVLV